MERIGLTKRYHGNSYWHRPVVIHTNVVEVTFLAKQGSHGFSEDSDLNLPHGGRPTLLKMEAY